MIRTGAGTQAIAGAVLVAFVCFSPTRTGTDVDAIEHGFAGLSNGAFDYLLTSCLFVGLAVTTVVIRFAPIDDLLRYQLLRFGTRRALTGHRLLRTALRYFCVLAIWTLVALVSVRIASPALPLGTTRNWLLMLGTLNLVGTAQLLFYSELVVLALELVPARMTPLWVALACIGIGALALQARLPLIPFGANFTPETNTPPWLLLEKACALTVAIVAILAISHIIHRLRAQQI